MKTLLVSLLVCGVLAFLGAVGISVLLALGARLPRVSPVSFAAACESSNTLATGITGFVILFLIGIPIVYCGIARTFATQDRPRLQFSIRLLLTLMLVEALLLGLSRWFVR